MTSRSAAASSSVTGIGGAGGLLHLSDEFIGAVVLTWQWSERRFWAGYRVVGVA
jgi:hypothetical protein